MSVGRIVAPLTGGEHDKVVLAGAFAAAKCFLAHVAAVFVRPDPAEAMPFFGEGVSTAVVQEIVTVAQEAAGKAAATAHATLETLAAAEGVALLGEPVRMAQASVSFHDMQGNFADCLSRTARLSDLVVFGPLRESDRPGLTEAFEEILVETGRPVLLSAFAPPREFGARIALAWDGSIPCAHAVTAALPYLLRAAEVEILSVRRNGAAHSLAELHEYLALHGVTFSDRLIEAGTRPVGEILLEAAAEWGAGILVLGGYGHSRIRQFFAGGVTRHVVSHATVPLFLVH